MGKRTKERTRMDMYHGRRVGQQTEGERRGRRKRTSCTMDKNGQKDGGGSDEWESQNKQKKDRKRAVREREKQTDN